VTRRIHEQTCPTSRGAEPGPRRAPAPLVRDSPSSHHAPGRRNRRRRGPTTARSLPVPPPATARGVRQQQRYRHRRVAALVAASLRTGPGLQRPRPTPDRQARAEPRPLVQHARFERRRRHRGPLIEAQQDLPVSAPWRVEREQVGKAPACAPRRGLRGALEHAVQASVSVNEEPPSSSRAEPPPQRPGTAASVSKRLFHERRWSAYPSRLHVDGGRQSGRAGRKSPPSSLAGRGRADGPGRQVPQ